MFYNQVQKSTKMFMTMDIYYFSFNPSLSQSATNTEFPQTTISVNKKIKVIFCRVKSA